MGTHSPEIHNQIFRHHAQSKKRKLTQFNRIKIVNTTCHFIPANFCCFQSDKFEASLQEPFLFKIALKIVVYRHTATVA